MAERFWIFGVPYEYRDDGSIAKLESPEGGPKREKRNPWGKHVCASFACGKKEVKKHIEFAKKAGVPTDYRYCPKTRDFEPVFTSQHHMEKFAIAKGCRVYC